MAVHARPHLRATATTVGAVFISEPITIKALPAMTSQD